ncbi:MAG: prolyl oligopeptidase family serine peptidase [Planctomycetota bacterium]
MAETMVVQQTPPAFLFHTSDDATVSWENSILYYQAMRSAGVPVELHLYEHGKHGLGLAYAIRSFRPGHIGSAIGFT